MFTVFLLWWFNFVLGLNHFMCCSDTPTDVCLDVFYLFTLFDLKRDTACVFCSLRVIGLYFILLNEVYTLKRSVESKRDIRSLSVRENVTENNNCMFYYSYVY